MTGFMVSSISPLICSASSAVRPATRAGLPAINVSLHFSKADSSSGGVFLSFFAFSKRFSICAGRIVGRVGFSGGTVIHTCGCVPYLRNVRQDELEVDDLDVANGVHGAVYVDDVVVHEATHHVHDGVSHANVLSKNEEGKVGGGRLRGR
jgi:hypothetical protein